MKHLPILLSCAALAVLALSCKSKTAATTEVIPDVEISPEFANYSFSVECIGVDPDGSQTLRAWGQGKDKAQAIEHAKKNALVEVIFKGINSGNGECSRRPILTEVNAQERYDYYFSAFFSDTGEYQDYIMLDENRTSRIKSASSSGENWGVIVTIDCRDLRQKLIDDNILKP